VTPEDRGKLLVTLANLVEKNIDLLSAVESLDNGKAFSMAKGDVGAVAGCLRYYGGWADKIDGKTIDTNPDTFSYTRQEAVSPPCAFHILYLTALAWRLRPDYPVEFPSAYAGDEDWPRPRHW
jgi:acyl-CoA reductase-like NAD-dependent aldehyde dehydrogenase